MEITFAGKNALVTGAGKGIGRGVAKALANGGAKTFALSRTQEDLDTLKADIPGISTICVDLADWEATKRAVQHVGPIDLLVNNAAITNLDGFFDISSDDFDRVIGVNLKSVLNVSQVVAKGMIERKSSGSIVNVSSVASSNALMNHTLYCTSKGGLSMMTKCMAIELGEHKIRVNSVNPTVVMTSLGKLAWSDPVKSRPMLDRIPLGRFAEIEDVVNSIIFLLSDKAAMLNGVELPVDGGFKVS